MTMSAIQFTVSLMSCLFPVLKENQANKLSCPHDEISPVLDKCSDKLEVMTGMKKAI